MANPRGNPPTLRPFPKGRSGNPGGRPKGTGLTALLRAELEEPSAPGSGITQGEALAEKLVSLALAGDLAAIREVLDRTEGKAVARQEAGEPGAFEELADKSTEELREMLRVVEEPVAPA